ncbi:MAG TPA: crotonase/enoyl-CoA hydratase family protein [Methylocella sp.]|nr:crotonase/enoyl-CoA hydratase family protein [Methylocella sp.]
MDYDLDYELTEPRQAFPEPGGQEGKQAQRPGASDSLPPRKGEVTDLSLSEQMRFASRTYQELEVTLDPNTKCIWCYLNPNGSTSLTPALIRELNVLHCSIQALAASHEEKAPLSYHVLASRTPGIFTTGGDLRFFSDKIQARDASAIRRYAYGCVDAVYNIASGFNSNIVSVGLLEGDALGGGLEGAISCNFIIAERGVKLGLPEILFNSFPGMGAYSILSRRISPAVAERIILSGRIYSAEEMCDLGVIDLVVDAGCGEAAVREYISDQRKHSARNAIYRARQQIHPLTLSELRAITDMWIQTMMDLSPSDLRRMGHLQSAQLRRLRRGSRSRPGTQQ